MKTLIALLIKFAVTFVAAWISFSLFDNVFLIMILAIAGAGTVINYLIGDLLILPRFGNTTASVLDGVMAAAAAYIILSTSNHNARSSIFIFAIMVAVFEAIFHMYLFQSNLFGRYSSKTGISGKPKLNYSTEIAKEMNPEGNYWKKFK